MYQARLSWLPVSFLLHVKYTLSYRIFTKFHENFEKSSLTVKVIEMRLSISFFIITRRLCSIVSEIWRLICRWSRFFAVITTAVFFSHNGGSAGT